MPDNNAEQPITRDASARAGGGRRKWPRVLIRFLLPLLILAAGGSGAAYFLNNRPKARQRPAERRVALVEVMRLAPSRQRVVVRAMGTVRAARTIVLRPRVSGQVVQVSPELLPGGLFEAGQRLLQIDPKDYELAERQKAGDVAKAQCDLKLETGRQSVAKREYELLGQSVQQQDQELVLRKPQLAMAQAAVAAAEAGLQKAKLDLARTDVRAPFNAMVQSKQVDPGSQVSPTTQLATLVGTDEYWVQASIPVDQLKWITSPQSSGQEGSPVRIFNECGWGPGVARVGYVTRLSADLEPEGRMAKLLITVNDPLGLESPGVNPPVMLIGMYVRVEIQGNELEGIFSVPRTALRDGRQVWIMGPNDTLEIRKVKIVWRGRDRVLVGNGLGAGDRMITSNLATPVEGMPLRIEAAGGGASPPAAGPTTPAGETN